MASNFLRRAGAQESSARSKGVLKPQYGRQQAFQKFMSAGTGKTAQKRGRPTSGRPYRRLQGGE